MVARDWTKTLWPASFKGVPFWSERSQESGGRRVVEHEFPMRDDPFLEDLGEALRKFDVTAYLASDAADAEASALAAVCAERGPGLLVLPMQGQVLVRCLEFARDHEKDRLGYIAFNLKCTREGASFSIASVASLANLVFIAADALAIAAAASFAANFVISGLQAAREPVDFVIAAATDGLQVAAATLEAVRTAGTVEPAASAAQRDAIQLVFDQIPNLLTDPATLADGPIEIIGIARALGDAMDPSSAVRAFEAVITDPALTAPLASAYSTRNLRAAAINDAAARRILRLAAFSAFCEAVARVSLTDRPMAITLRANVAEFSEAEIVELPAAEIELVHAIEIMRDAVVTYLSKSILDLAPVLNLEANRSMPSLFWAWRIYQDPVRSIELAARNKVAHPSFMPTVFEALAR